MSRLTNAQKPSWLWISYNLFRLVAVIFAVWTLVVQFVALADDLSEYSANSSRGSSETFTIPLSQLATAKTTSVDAISNIGVYDASTSTLAYGSPSEGPGTTAISTSTLQTTTSDPAISVPTSLDGPAIPLVSAIEDEPLEQQSDVGMNQNRHRTLSRRKNEYGYVGGSSVPDQPAGVLAVVLSRIFMAIILLALVFAQIGWPEQKLYDHVSWLGPQSTSMTLGLSYIVIAIENLDVHESQVLLTPAWSLLAIGLVNMLWACSLLYLGRKLPKQPRHPLYFSLATRLLYWTRPPPCYQQILNPPTDLEEDPEKAVGDSDNSVYELGDPSEDEQNEQQTETYQPDPLVAPLQATDVRMVHDIRQGGYPTFSGGDVDQPGRHVPAGVVERGKDGEVIRYIADDGQAVTRPDLLHKSTGLSTQPVNPETEIQNRISKVGGSRSSLQKSHNAKKQDKYANRHANGGDLTRHLSLRSDMSSDSGVEVAAQFPLPPETTTTKRPISAVEAARDAYTSNSSAGAQVRDSDGNRSAGKQKGLPQQRSRGLKGRDKHREDVSASSQSQRRSRKHDSVQLLRTQTPEYAAPRLVPKDALSEIKSSMAVLRSPSSRSKYTVRRANGIRFDVSPLSAASIGSTGPAFPSSPTRRPPPDSPHFSLAVPPTSEQPSEMISIPTSELKPPNTPRPQRRSSIDSIATSELLENDLQSTQSAEKIEASEHAGPESLSSGFSVVSRAREQGQPASQRSSGTFGPRRSGARSTRDPAGAQERRKTAFALGGSYLDEGQEIKAQRGSQKRHSSVDI